MLTAGVLKFDEFGRILVSSAFPENFNGGTPIAADGTLAAALDVEPEVFLGAIGYLQLGRITNSVSPLLPPEGPLTNGDGQLAVDTGMPAYWYAGLPFTVAGRLSINPGIVPDEGAFDQGFDQQAFN